MKSLSLRGFTTLKKKKREETENKTEPVHEENRLSDDPKAAWVGQNKAVWS